MSRDRYETRRKLIKIKDYLDVMDVVLLSGYSISSIRRARNEGKLKAHQPFPKGKLLFHRDDVKSWIEGGR